MAHGIKRIKIEKKDELECNNNQQSVNNINKMALNNLLLDNCCQQSSSNQSLINQKNSSTNTNAAVISTAISTHQLLPPTQSASTLMNNSNNSNKLSLNCGGASLSTITSSSSSASSSKSPTTSSGTTKMGSRRIFTPQFKLQVLESYRNDIDCKGNQRATARKYGIHRRQIQKWLQCENNLRSIIANNPQNVKTNSAAIKSQTMQKATAASAPILSSSATNSRHRGVVVVGANTDKSVGTYSCFTLTNAKSYKSNNNVGSSTKSLSTTSSSSFTDYSMNNNATVIETNRNSNFNFSPASTSSYCYDNVAIAAPRLMYNVNIHLHHHQHQEKVVAEDLPIDLSCNNRIIKSEAVARPIAIHPSSVDYKIPFLHHYMTSAASSSSSSLSPPHQHHLTDISNSVVVVKSEFRNDPIDLSVANVSHKRKLSTDNVGEKADKKPVKLFRPYLDDNFDKEENHHQQQQQQDEEQQKFPLIWSNGNYHQDLHHPSSHPFLMSVGSFYDHHATPSPVLPSPNDSGIIHHHNSSFQTLMPPSQASPVSGYDSSTSSIYSYNENEADNSQGSSPHYTSSHYDAPSPISSATMSPTTETKVPLLSPTSLHDLKFKLHALDCFYNDSECKGNEKLVANKLNINCKIVEKWLRHENDLRHQQKQYHLDILV